MCNRSYYYEKRDLKIDFRARHIPLGTIFITWNVLRATGEVILLKQILSILPGLFSYFLKLKNTTKIFFRLIRFLYLNYIR